MQALHRDGNANVWYSDGSMVGVPPSDLSSESPVFEVLATRGTDDSCRSAFAV